MTKAQASQDLSAADPDHWRTYDDFAAGIDTYRLPNADLTGRRLAVTLDDGTRIDLEFTSATEVRWGATGSLAQAAGTVDPYDAVAVRDDVIFLNLPLQSRERQAITIFYSTRTHRALAVHSQIADVARDGEPRVHQDFHAGVTDGGPATGEIPAVSRDLIGKRNLYRYSPVHLYEHFYVNSERYAWQCVQGVQRGHGDMDLSTVWKFEDGIYLFAFREFRIAVASVWMHDLGYNLRTTGIFLGLNGEGAAEHSRAGGVIYPLGSVTYPDVQPV